ncbi:MAG: EscN/YscN/HrcN family type III secretion system ATPase, partial [Firmicutes bacterium]|nr:EscN/YscN/HrcN family type III secretion system ATPase [Bacillota bacterium]
EHRTLAGELRAALATYRDAEDLINIGAYSSGSNPQIDMAISLYPEITKFLQQGINETSSWSDTVQYLEQIFVAES